MEAVYKGSGGALDVLGLAAEEACGLDELLYLVCGGGCEGLGGGEEAEELGSGFIDAYVGGLGGEDGCDGELEGVAVGEGADDAGVGAGEGVQDGGDAVWG